MPEAVYISSTFNDLKVFRQAIINIIASLGDFYKSVSIMEFYDAEDIHFVKKCLDDIEACNIYILILGDRYGYIPKGFDKSITELEYEKAVACQQAGKKIEILVFKVGPLCSTYKYEEADPNYKLYNQAFLDEVSERLSPKPFDSEAELKLQVSLSLMKRLFKGLQSGNMVIAPDKDAALCYCDRNVQMTSLKKHVLIDKKRIFIIYGNRKTDFPTGITKRFAKYSLGTINKIEPLIKITDLIVSNDTAANYVSAFYSILDYLNCSPTAENTSTVEGFLTALGQLKTAKIILPFYYDFDFEEDSNKMDEYINLANYLYEGYEKLKPSYQLFSMIFIYSPQPDADTVRKYMEAYPLIQIQTAFIEKLKPVGDNDIIDWIEKFITSSEFSSALYEDYFSKNMKDYYSMQEVNLTLSRIIEDLGSGSDNIKKYL